MFKSLLLTSSPSCLGILLSRWLWLLIPDAWKAIHELPFHQRSRQWKAVLHVRKNEYRYVPLHWQSTMRRICEQAWLHHICRKAPRYLGVRQTSRKKGFGGLSEQYPGVSVTYQSCRVAFESCLRYSSMLSLSGLLGQTLHTKRDWLCTWRWWIRYRSSWALSLCFHTRQGR